MGSPSPIEPDPPAPGRRSTLGLIIAALAMVLIFSAAFVVTVTRLSADNDRLRERIEVLEKTSEGKSVRIEQVLDEKEGLESRYSECHRVASVVERTRESTETLLRSSNRVQVLRGITRLLSLRGDLKRAVNVCLTQE